MPWDSGNWDEGAWDSESDAEIKQQPPFPIQQPPQHPTRLHRMNDRQRNQVQRLLRVKGFCDEYAPLFTNTPPKPGDVKFAAGRTAIGTLLTQIQGRQAVQASGSFGQASGRQEVERLELVELMRAVIRTAGAIADERDDPALIDRFRMPRGTNDVELVARANAFADAIVELNLAAAFTEHGYEGDVVADLRAEAQDVTDAEQEQGSAQGTQKGATASLPGLLRDARIQVQALDAVIRNRYRNDPDMLARWQTASHVVASGGGGTEPPAPPAPPAGGGGTPSA